MWGYPVLYFFHFNQVTTQGASKVFRRIVLPEGFEEISTPVACKGQSSTFLMYSIVKQWREAHRLVTSMSSMETIFPRFGENQQTISIRDVGDPFFKPGMKTLIEQFAFPVLHCFFLSQHVTALAVGLVFYSTG